MTSVDPGSRQRIADHLQELTPGEFMREEYDKDQDSSEAPGEKTIPVVSVENIANAIAGLAQKVDEGHEPSLMEISNLAIRVAQENPRNRADLMGSLFRLVDANKRYVTSWDRQGQWDTLKELIPIIRENEIWELMGAAVRPTGDEYWLRSVSRNVHLLCLYRSAAYGTKVLKEGTQRVFAMHRLWAGLPEQQYTLKIEPSSEAYVDTWSEFVSIVLCRLLASDSAETVSAALRGLCAVAEIVPQAVSALIAGSEGIQRSRLLLGAEVWAARHPLQFTTVLEDLWNRKDELFFSDRIQLWICSLSAAQVEEGFRSPETFMPENSSVPDTHSSSILTKPKRLLEIETEKQGSVLLANKFSAARYWINRLGKITGYDTGHIEAVITEGINAQSDEIDGVPNSDKKKHFATEDGDMVINCGVGSIFDNALVKELRNPRWCDGDAGAVAMAVTHGDDPWILRRSPLPSPACFDWPDQKEVDEWLDTRLEKAGVLNRLRLMALGNDLPADQQVLGSCLRLFTSHYDFDIWYWLEAKRLKEVATRNAPLCPSSRSFQFFLHERCEPRAPDRAPLVLFSRSILCLSFSTLEIVPSSILQNRLGWNPSPRNPLEWTRDDRNIARYELYHGPLDCNWSRRHMRHSTLSRWVVNTDELNDLGHLFSEWGHECHRFSDK